MNLTVSLYVKCKLLLIMFGDDKNGYLYASSGF